MMVIDKFLLESLSAEAAASSRLRMNRDFRNSADDQSQRMLNALEPGTELPIHRHRKTSETCVILKGIAKEIFYADNGSVTKSVLLRPNSDCIGVQIPIGVWHKIVALEPGTVIFEAKDGKYEPLSKEDILEI